MYWYWEVGYTWTALVYTYVQVLPVCTGQSVLYRPLYRLAARHLLLGQSRRVRRMVIWIAQRDDPGSRPTRVSTKNWFLCSRLGM